jgi:hypothetical protein
MYEDYRKNICRSMDIPHFVRYVGGFAEIFYDFLVSEAACGDWH